MGQITSIYKEFYSKNIFIRVKSEPPKIKDVIASNHCMSFSIDGRNLVVMTAIDNLIKGVQVAQFN